MAAETSAHSRGSVNLRHRGRVSEQDIKNLPSTLDRLWIGPSLPASMRPDEVVRCLPASLSQLDLDLTRARLDSDRAERIARHYEDDDDDEHYDDGLYEENTEEDFVLQGLFERLGNMQDFTLRLYGDSGAIAVAKSLPIASKLTTLNLRGNRIGDVGTNAIVTSLIGGCYDGKSPVRHLILSWNEITSYGAVALSALLEQDRCPNLQCLDLSCNELLDDDALYVIARGLRTNTGLHELKLFCCPRITHVGANHLLSCLREDNMTLHRVSLQASTSHDLLPVLDLINHYLMFNRAGRMLLREYSPTTEDDGSASARRGTLAVPDALWPYVMSRCGGGDSSLPFADTSRIVGSTCRVRQSGSTTSTMTLMCCAPTSSGNPKGTSGNPKRAVASPFSSPSSIPSLIGNKAKGHDRNSCTCNDKINPNILFYFIREKTDLFCTKKRVRLSVDNIRTPDRREISLKKHYLHTVATF